MKKGILTILAYFVMCGVSYASDVYITQSGASLTANINQDGQTNKFGDATTDVTLTGDNQIVTIRLLYRLVLTLHLLTTVLFRQSRVVLIQLR
jgi:hypothetical protein